MADNTPPVDEMHYEVLAQDALRGVIRAALERAASPDGIPGAHHFYITFVTRAEGVSVPADVLAKYPDEITVVLQHQYEDLTVDPDEFSVRLRFGGMPKFLTVPYKAVTRFYDPSVQFLLQFEAPVVAAGPVVELSPPPREAASIAPVEDDDDNGGDDGPKVVSLDKFRKK
jgi:hypothetical protein